MTDNKQHDEASKYPEEWLRSKSEAKEMEKIDEEMRLRIKKVLQESKK